MGWVRFVGVTSQELERAKLDGDFTGDLFGEDGVLQCDDREIAELGDDPFDWEWDFGHRGHYVHYWMPSHLDQLAASPGWRVAVAREPRLQMLLERARRYARVVMIAVLEVYGRYTLLNAVDDFHGGTRYRARTASGDPVLFDLFGLDREAPPTRGAPWVVEEASLTARTLGEHANIARVLEIGLADDWFFVVREPMRGIPAERLAASSIDARLACSVIVQACAGLDHAHRRTDDQGAPLGIVHGRIAPSKLFITFEGVVKLLGFELRHLDTLLSFRRRPPAVSACLSPEWAAAPAVDARADVYSLGAAVFELLAGRPLYAGDGPYDLIKPIVRGPPDALRDLRPDLPVPLAELVSRCLSRDPADRPQTARELAAAATACVIPLTREEIASRLYPPGHGGATPYSA